MIELHDLVGAYALDAVDAEERRLFEAHLENCQACQAELAEMREATAFMAGAVAAPAPAELKDVVMAAIDGPTAAEVYDLQSRRRSRVAWTVASVAAAIALVFFGLWTVASNQLTEADQIAAVYEAPDAQVVDLESTHGPVRFVYSASVGDGVLNGGQLVDLDEGDIYELWLIGADGPVAAGTLQPGETAVLVDGVAPGLVLAMTVEPAPGVDAPTSDPILVTEL